MNPREEGLNNRKLLSFVASFLLACLAGCNPVSEPLETTEPTNSRHPLPSISRTSQPVADGPLPWNAEVYNSWQWQLTEEIDLSIQADLYDLDLFDTTEAIIQEIHRNGGRVICYTSVGSLEDWRPDADAFPDEIIGRKYPGWSGERFLDIRRMDVLAPVLSARIQMCQQKGFDALEPDNMDTFDSENRLSN